MPLTLNPKRLSLDCGPKPSEGTIEVSFTIDASIPPGAWEPTFAYATDFSSRPYCSNRYQFQGPRNVSGCYVIDKYDEETEQYTGSDLIVPSTAPFIGTVQIPTVRQTSLELFD